jgi:DNA primase
LEEVLVSLGHHPTKQNEKEAWYLNPFSTETQASFKLNKRNNVWYLHSEGIGGNNIDFMKKYSKRFHKRSFRMGRKQNFSSFQHQSNSNPKQEALANNYTIIEIKDIQHPALLEYLKTEK